MYARRDVFICRFLIRLIDFALDTQSVPKTSGNSSVRYIYYREREKKRDLYISLEIYARERTPFTCNNIRHYGILKL